MRIRKPDTSVWSKLDTDRKPQKGWYPNQRQQALLQELHTLGLIDDQQAGWLLGVGWRRSKEILAPLWNNGYINRPSRKLRARYPYMFYWLTRKGAQIVAQDLNVQLRDLDWMRHPRWSQVEHDVAVNDFRLIFQTACRKTGLAEVLDWIPETTLHSWADAVRYTDLSGETKKRRFIADGYTRIKVVQPVKDKYFRFLLEVELAAKTNPRFAEQKLLPGVAYLGSAQYAKRFLGRGGRMLYVVPSEQKRVHYCRTAEKVLAQDDYRYFYFTKMDDVQVDQVLSEAIWWRPGDRSPVSLLHAET